MSEQEVIALFVLAGVIFTALTGVIVAIITGRYSAAQEAFRTVVASLREELETVREQVKDNDSRIQRLERRDRQWADYVHILRRHITAQKPPPPPEWPAGLDQ